MIKISPYWLILALLVGIAVAYIYITFIFVPEKTFSVRKTTNKNIVTLSLPNSSDPAVFGPHYWESYHKLTDMIPCASCRSKAVPFISFFHDIVNHGTGKPYFDADNYNKHIDFIKNLPKA